MKTDAAIPTSSSIPAPTAEYSYEVLDPQNPSHQKSSADIMRLIWGENDFSSVDYVNWQYRKNPFGPVIGYFAWPEVKPADGVPAAQYVVVPSQLWLPSLGKIVSSALSVNTATHPKHQKKGLFVKSAQRTFDRAKDLGVANVYGFPNDNSLPGFVKTGFAQLPQLQFFFGVISYSGSASKLGTVIKNWKFPQLTDLQVRAPSEISANFSERAEISKFGHCPRSETWIRWRYLHHPTRHYTLIGDGDCGFVFCFKQLHGLKIALLMDVLGSPTPSAVRTAKSFLKSTNTHVVAGVFTQNHFQVFPETRPLVPFRVPLKYSPKPFHLILKDLSGNGLPTDEFYCTLGDIDLY